MGTRAVPRPTTTPTAPTGAVGRTGGRRNRRKTGHDQDGEGGELQDREDVQRDGGGLDAQVVDDAQEQDGADGDAGREFGWQPRERHYVARAGDGDGGRGAGRNDQQQRPAVQERGERTERVPQVHVAP